MRSRQIITHEINSIAEFHQVARLPKPQHPLVSLVDYGQVHYQTRDKHVGWVQSFYSIGLKRNILGKFGYGQQTYDFDEGLMSFIAPGQVVNFEVEEGAEKDKSGWILCIHPDFLWDTSLAKTIGKYDFFGYAIHEALFLSEREEELIVNVMKNIAQEYHTSIDKFTQNIIIAQVEVLLNYAERFYQRQFITRKINNHRLLTQLEDLLKDYFTQDDLISKGAPSVHHIADLLNVSPNYLSSLLKVLTGQNTRQHIQNKLIDRAKERLSTTSMSVSEVAYELGFEHPQSFTRLFKTKTKMSPLQFRQSFT